MRLYKSIDSHCFFNNEHYFTGFNKGVLVNFYKDGNRNFIRKYRYIRDDTDLLTKYTEEFNDKYFL